MIAYIVCVLFVIANNYQHVHAEKFTDVFEFGINRGKVTFSTSGTIGIWAKDKVTVIPVKAEDCTKITYVRVEVRNVIAPPHVRFDDNISSVVIKYRPLQPSLSNYVVIAKTKRVDCGNSNDNKPPEDEEYDDDN